MEATTSKSMNFAQDLDTVRHKQVVLASNSISFSDCMLVVIWWAMLASAVETCRYLSTCFIKNSFIFSSPHVFWMNVVLQLLAVSIVCVPIYLIARNFRQATLGLVTIFAAFTGTFTFLAAFSQLSLLAICFLAMGVTIQVVRKTDAHPEKFLQFYRSTTWLLVASILVSIGVGIVSFYRGTSAVAGLQNQPDSGLVERAKNPPNVLMVVLDTVGYDALFNEKQIGNNTPNLQRIAKESLVYQSAYSTSPWTLPAHASLLTGLLPSEHKASWTKALPREIPTITQWLNEQDYRTGAFVANHWYCSRETGIGRGFDHFDDEQISVATLLSSTSWSRRFVPLLLGFVGVFPDSCKTKRRSAATIHQRAVKWINQDSPKPWFALVNLFDAHDPYIAPGTRGQLSDLEFKKLQFWWDMDKQSVSDTNLNLQLTNYGKCLTYLDQQISVFLERLKEFGQLKNTVVIITADHGEHFGDHQLYGHGNSLYQPLIHVPLLIWSSPDIRQRTGIDRRLVSLCDIPHTIARLVAPSAETPFAGSDLFDNQRSAKPVFSEIQTPSLWPACRGRSPVFRGAMRSVCWKDFKYIRTGNDEEVYRISTDAEEAENLADSMDPIAMDELRGLVNKQFSDQ